jgi:glycosyltransferase involved in cell wall biosynthesis
MTAKLPKVAISFPSGDMVHADFALALAGLCNSTPPLETPIINNKSSIVAIARNNGIKRAQELETDFILFLDSDMVFPRTTLHRLLLHRKDIVGATYTKRVAPYSILGLALDSTPVCDARGLTEMRHLPTGCLLIRMEVFKSLSQPYFRFLNDEKTGEIMGEDYVFCDRAREAGFGIWCDTTLSQEIGHIGQQIYKIPSDPRE